MATYEITIDETNASSKHFLKYIKTLPFVCISNGHKKKQKKSGLDEALEDIRMGRVTAFNSMEEFKTHLDEIWQEAENEV